MLNDNDDGLNGPMPTSQKDILGACIFLAIIVGLPMLLIYILLKVFE